MPVRTTEEILDHLRGFYPRWLLALFESIESQGTEDGETLIRAVYAGLAEANHQVEATVEAAVEQTYIDTATGRWLDLHGTERDKPRLPGETDEAYRPRIKANEDMVTRPALEARILALLLVPDGWYFFEHENDAPFYNRGHCLNRRARAFEEREAFTIFLPPQIPPYRDDAFYNRGACYSRDAFAGSAVELFNASVYRNIWSEVMRIRAAGVAQHLELLT